MRCFQKRGEKMKIYELKVKVKLKKQLNYISLIEKTNYFIDSALSKDSVFCEYHKSRDYKGYVHDLFYPIEQDGIYKTHKVYTMRIRTIDESLAKYFMSQLSFNESIELKGVGCEIKIIAKRPIQTLYSITPAVLKTPELGYWRNHMTLEQFEKRLKDNLIKKYKYFTGNDLDENFVFYDLIEFKNKVPVKLAYKDIHLLGDKIHLEIAQNQQAQDLAYLALGVGILEGNTRGSGFVNFKYM